MEGPETKEAQKELFFGPRGTAVKILNRADRSDAYFDKLLDAELRSTELSDADKGLLAEIVHGVMRWRMKLDWVLNGFFHGNFVKAEVTIKNALRVALYQIQFLQKIPHHAAVDEAVEFVKRIRGEKAAGLVNGVLRNIVRNLDGIRYPLLEEDPIQYLAIVYSHPHWMVKRWVERFGFGETEKLLIANNERPELSLRINKLKVDPGQFLASLDQLKAVYRGSTYIDYFVRVRGISGISQLDLFRNGCFTIQDESAAFPSILLTPQPGERIIDMCAAPGGKTTHIAELMKNTGEIIAVDKYENKLKLLMMSCERLGIRIVKPVAGVDARELDTAIADRILLDAPCSGLGTLTKKPDIKWKREPEDLPRLAQTQMELLSNAARLLKPGGVLVYSTCTIEPEENFLLVKNFIHDHPEFSIDDSSKYVNRDVVKPEGYVETLPQRHGMDGSFAVRLTKSVAPIG
ncbi:MAG TPA: 16S rRNA (cytosine(967)-C(5))-methyltransferase RsmB [Bacteroidota bacterium]